MFQISSKYRELVEELENADGEFTPELLEKLKLTEEDLKQKAEAYGFVIKAKKSRIEHAKNMKKHYDALIKKEEYDIERLEHNLIRAIGIHGEIKTPSFKFSISPSEVVNIENETEIPKKFLKVAKAEPDISAIKVALKAGEKVKGAVLAKNSNLRIGK